MKTKMHQVISTLLCALVMLATAFTVSASAANMVQGPPAVEINTFVEIPAFAAMQRRGGVQYTSDPEAAAKLLREGLVDRQPEIPVNFQCSQSEASSNQAVVEIGFALYDLACGHTGVPDQGDYLLWHLSQIGLGASYYTSNGTTYIQFVFTPLYYTTAQQETQLDAAVESLVSQLKLDEEISEYEKIFNIYHYICSNVAYDYENLNNDHYPLKYSAYAALMDQKAVCQGYSLLFYRLALEAGIDNRVITGVSWDGAQNVNHAWNMVELGGEYYYLDTTWDAGRVYSDYFLKTKSDFRLHYAYEEYTDEAFFAAYPQAQSSYVFSADVGGIGDSVSLGHREVDVPEEEPSCVKEGMTEGVCCSACGEILQGRNVLPALGHQYVPVITPPTCGAQGYTTHTCCVCQDHYTDSHTQATGEHTYSNDKDKTCDLCGYVRQPVVDPALIVAMYRMYNPNTGEHFYTGSTVERDNLVVAGWHYEGEGFRFYANDPDPVYRLFEPATGEHLYTMDEDEKTYLLANGWNYEGVAFNSAADDEAPQYRLHNPNATVGAYHFTNSTVERDNLISLGWEYQGIGWYSLLR